MTTPLSLRERSEVVGRPRYEGSNICTWIGFKHVMYLVEEAVLDHLRQSGLVPRQLYEEHGLGVEIVDSDARIASALHMDDEVHTEVVSRPSEGDTLVFRTTSHVQRPTGRIKAVSATVRVQVRPADQDSPDGRAFVVGATDGRGGVDVVDDDVAALVGDDNAIVWRWRVPYFYCHFSRTLQHSGYLRLMEEVVDVFLAERGISIRTMLDGQRWIPVVPHARVTILADALMEEEIHTVFTVEEIFKDFTYTARMDCYVRRDGRLVQTATGRITHGYAEVLDRRDWKLVSFDSRTLAALRGKG
ncbi:thioesterase family protein [Solwaraspora sp. WMMD1047]|uniref:thioesterase family protein n=1 Tax=Solwaraspora sp. WMMD1047 TaxID=3016102 RepID=UPI002417F0D8|nr:thioesterase family protein [Solwaraspora sp. WMMD1047]MDG4831696.1 thioesterase family protein [Solwaraspora sp. WMMD1047]